MRTWWAVVILMAVAACGSENSTDADPNYAASIDTWHAGRIDRLRSDTGWLTLIGLHRLETGSQTVGSGEDAEVRMNPPAPPLLGTMEVSEGVIQFIADPKVQVIPLDADGNPAAEPVERITLVSDQPGPPTVLTAGSLVFYVIDRDGVLFLRVKDRDSKVLKEFDGIERFPVDPAYRVRARLEGEPGTVKVPNVLGQESEVPTPGDLVFELKGKKVRLTPQGDQGGSLFIVFGDETNGKTTYMGGRFLGTGDPEEDGTYILDFNKATDPPCVFTPYATCPLPPMGNLLPVGVEAGEKMWGEAH